jgi:hypothetical protein
MGLFQLDPDNLVRRTHSDGDVPRVPTLAGSVIRGAIGFTIVSVLGFLPWALGGGFFYPRIGATGLYSLCALVFVVTSGLFLHKLIMGPNTLGRFYKVFTPAFVLYAAAWMGIYFKLGGHAGGFWGLLAGCVLMGAVLGIAFEAGIGKTVASIVALFVLNALGYFAGGWYEQYPQMFESFQKSLGLDRRTAGNVAATLWGVFYGVTFGAGIGLAFYICQSEARGRIGKIRPS